MTTPRTLPTSRRRGQSHVRQAHRVAVHRTAVWTAHRTGRWRTYSAEEVVTMVFWIVIALLVAFFAWASWVVRRRNQVPAWRDAPTDPTIGGPMRGDGS